MDEAHDTVTAHWSDTMMLVQMTLMYVVSFYTARVPHLNINIINPSAIECSRDQTLRLNWTQWSSQLVLSVVSRAAV